jgi:geranylgeranyl transferase type-2 subunit alpha
LPYRVDRCSILRTDPPDKVLRREIISIRELHDTEPDSKCKTYAVDSFVDPTNRTGCMNALANYLLLQASLPSTDKFKATRQREEAKSLFGRLEEVDPDRKQRYKDMAASC